jgi:hypothetical protein
MADETKDKKTKKGLGFKEDGTPYPGVHPETGERHAVTLDGMKKEFGPKAGEIKFRQIGLLTGTLDGLAPLERQSAAMGGIQLLGMDEETQFKVNEILTAKEA